MLVKMTSKNQERCVAGGLFAIALAVYLRTLCPTLYWGDCGELATAAYNLGIAHPTGYPLWCMIGKLWTLVIPFGTIVWRLNTMSAFFGALAIACFYGFLRCSGIARSIAIAASGMLAFSFTLWQQCLFCETYSMTAFYTCLLLFLAVAMESPRTRRCRSAFARRRLWVRHDEPPNEHALFTWFPGLYTPVRAKTAPMV